MMDKWLMVIPPKPAPTAKPSWTNELLRLRSIPEALGAIEAKLKLCVGPNVHDAATQIKSKSDVKRMECATKKRRMRATRCTDILPKSVRVMPIRSAKKPANFEPTKLAMPRANKIVLISCSLRKRMENKKGVM